MHILSLIKVFHWEGPVSQSVPNAVRYRAPLGLKSCRSLMVNYLWQLLNSPKSYHKYLFFVVKVFFGNFYALQPINALARSWQCSGQNDQNHSPPPADTENQSNLTLPKHQRSRLRCYIRLKRVIQRRPVLQTSPRTLTYILPSSGLCCALLTDS